MSSLGASTPERRLDWLDALKALAILGILLNHLVEEFGSGPWFTNPNENWPDLATRLSEIFPSDYDSWIVSSIQFLGWLGDSAPGVFIFVSGFGLAWAALGRTGGPGRYIEFVRRRLVRILPLYIASHFVLLTLALVVPGNELSFASRLTLFSLLGLRFTDSLFFYISPSWWFVWLIIQMYLVFPFLFALMQRVRLTWFVMLTVGFTIASRGLGLMDVMYSESLYYWMTGIFFGTRLAEFTIGMAAATLLWRRRAEGQLIPTSPTTALAFSLVAYLAGLGCSFTWPGTLVANLLVTLGMSGVFYALWEGVLRRIRPLAVSVLWIGAESFSVYLLHQPPLMWTRAIADPMYHLAAALAVLVAVFAGGPLLDRGVRWLVAFGRSASSVFLWRAASVAAGLTVVGVLILVDPILWDEWKRRVFALGLGILVAVLLRSEYGVRDSDRWPERLLRWVSAFGAAFSLFVAPPRLGGISLSLGALCAGVALLWYRRVRLTPAAVALGGVGGVAIVLAAEGVLLRVAPVEAGRWGEFDALEAHPTRDYALKPGMSTHLRYNNYDYTLRTNSLGLAGPEVLIPRDPATLRILIVGDAFSMPEGVDYDQSYAAALQRRFDRCVGAGRVEVVNAGVTGYGPVQQYAQLRELAPVLVPDLVLYQFFVNEYRDVQLTTRDVHRSIGFPTDDESMVHRLFRRSQAVVRLQQLGTFLGELWSGEPALWRDWKALLPYYRLSETGVYTPESIERVRSYLVGMDSIASGVGAEFMVFFVPGASAVQSPADLSYYPPGEDLTDELVYDVELPLRHLEEVAAFAEIPVFDLTPGLRSHRPQPVYHRDSWHWNAEGHRAATEAILDALVRARRVPPACGSDTPNHGP